jgi:putative SOS response-associated peptidase YedK
MPVILHPDTYGQWLDPEIPSDSLEELLVPFPTDRMSIDEVSSLVNNAQCNAPDCIQTLN